VDPYLQLVFLGWYGINVFFAVYVRSLYPAARHRHGPTRVHRGLGGAVLRGGAGHRLAVFFTRLVPPLAAGSALIGAYIAWGLFKAGACRPPHRAPAAGRPGVLAVAVVHDAVNYTHLWRLSLLPYAVMLFVGVPAYLMARPLRARAAVEERIAIEQRERADLLVRSTKAGLLNWDAIGGPHDVFGPAIARCWATRRARGPGAAGVHRPGAPGRPRSGERQLPRQLKDRSVRAACACPASRWTTAAARRRRVPVDPRRGGVGVRRAGPHPALHLLVHRHLRDKRHEAEMSNRIKFMFDSVPLGLACGTRGKHLFVNRTWERNIGAARLLGVRCRTSTSPWLGPRGAGAALPRARPTTRAGASCRPARP
jgi:hypothetical protein